MEPNCPEDPETNAAAAEEHEDHIIPEEPEADTIITEDNAFAAAAEEHEGGITPEEPEADAVVTEDTAVAENAAGDEVGAGNGQDNAVVEEDNKGDEAICTICLGAYTDQTEPENFKLVLPCSHHFHLLCIAEWEDITSNCPLCRRNIV